MIERIKQYLRYNPFYIKYCKTSVNDMRYFFRDVKRYVREFGFSGKRAEDKNTLYFIMDPKMKHPGMVDRFKVIACLNHIAKSNGFDFRIVKNPDFPIERYFIKDERLMAESSSLSHNLRDVRLFSYNGGKKRIPRLNHSVRQYHVYNYIGLDMLENCFPENEWKAIWADSFNEVFAPNDDFTETIVEWSSGFVPPHEYVAVHFRFVNALEHFEDNFSNSLSEDAKINLINSCINSLEIIRSQHPDKPLVVFSDSASFLGIAKERGCLTPPQKGCLGHVSFNPTALQKALFDFYLISRSAVAYSVRGGKLYTSEYPKYAAMSGRVPFHIHYIEL